MKRFVGLGVVVSILLMSGMTYGARRGSNVIITKKDGNTLEGELIAVKRSSLLILGSRSGADESVDLADIMTVRVSKRSRPLKGMLIGAAAGTLVGLATKPGPPENTVEQVVEILTGARAFYVPTMALIGTTAGFTGGLLSGKDKSIRIDRVPPAAIEKALKYLEKRARVRGLRSALAAASD